MWGRYPNHPAKSSSLREERDPEVLRAALIRDRRAPPRGVLARMQMEVVKLALDLLVREPDIEGFFGGLTKTMVEESESHTCAVWLIDEDGAALQLWMAYVKDRLFTPQKGGAKTCEDDGKRGFPCESMAAHLFDYTPGGARPSSTRATTPDCRSRFESSAASRMRTRSSRRR